MELRREARSGAAADLAFLDAPIRGRHARNASSTTVADKLPVAASRLLRASCMLWTATDVDGVVAAAQVLLNAAAPGTKVLRFESTMGDSRGNPHRIGLPGGATLRICPPDGAHQASLASAVDMVRARVMALGERAELVRSVERLSHELEQRVSERTHALASANRDLRAELAERERVEARLKYETLHDSLTGLPNRDYLSKRLNNALKGFHEDSTKSFTVLFMDLDRFKVINDSVGHLVGDDLLVQVGHRIRACLKPDDVVARLGGDEFGVLLEGTDVEQACRVAQRLIRTVSAPFRIDGRELFTSTSIGITQAAAHHRHPGELLRDADSAMYRAKSGGRHRYVVFDKNLRQQADVVLRSVGTRPSKPDLARLAGGSKVAA